jgi:hypothetical protein
MGVPLEQLQSEVCAVLGPPLTARVASRAVEGCVLKLIYLVAWSQNKGVPAEAACFESPFSFMQGPGTKTSPERSGSH